jgi:hypothetical protein
VEVPVAEQTEARKKAEQMERLRLKPASTRNKALSGALKGPNMMEGPSEVYDFVRSVVSPRAPRTEDEMSELTREVSRGEIARKRPGNIDATMSPTMRDALMTVRDAEQRKKMGKRYDEIMPDPYGEGKAKGGSIKGYAKGGVARADGCAQRGKTRGKFV